MKAKFNRLGSPTTIEIDYSSLWGDINLYSSPDNINWTFITNAGLTGQGPHSGSWMASVELIPDYYYQLTSVGAFGVPVQITEKYVYVYETGLELVAVGPTTFTANWTNAYGDVHLTDLNSNITTIHVAGPYPATGSGTSDGLSANDGTTYQAVTVASNQTTIPSNTIQYQAASITVSGWVIQLDVDTPIINIYFTASGIYGDIIVQTSETNSDPWTEVMPWPQDLSYPFTGQSADSDITGAVPFNYYRVAGTDGDGNSVYSNSNQCLPTIYFSNVVAVDNYTTTYYFEFNCSTNINVVTVQYSTDNETWNPIYYGSWTNLHDNAYSYTLSNMTGAETVYTRVNLNVDSVDYTSNVRIVTWAPQVVLTGATDNGDGTTSYTYTVSGAPVTDTVLLQWSTDSGSNWWPFPGIPNFSTNGSFTLGNYVVNGPVDVRLQLVDDYYNSAPLVVTWSVPAYSIALNSMTDDGYGVLTVNLTISNLTGSNGYVTLDFNGYVRLLTSGLSNGTNTYTIVNQTTGNFGATLLLTDGPLNSIVSPSGVVTSNSQYISLSTPPTINLEDAISSGGSTNYQWDQEPGSAGTSYYNIQPQYSTDGGSTWNNLSYSWGGPAAGVTTASAPNPVSGSVQVRLSMTCSPAGSNVSNALSVTW